MWDLDLALNNDPKFVTAMKLKEKLMDKREWEDEGGPIRTFVMNQIMKKEGLMKPLFGRPGPPFEFPTLRGPCGFEESGDDGPQASITPDIQ